MNINLSSKDILELAISKHKKQDLSGAEKLYQEVLNKDDKNFNANFLLGTLFASTKRFELALTKLEKAKAINPNDADTYNNLANVYKEQNKIELAKKNYNLAIKINPKHINAIDNLGLIFLQENELSLAEANFKKAISINPNFINAHYNLGLAYVKLGKLLKAKESYLKVIQINPNFVIALNALGNISNSLEKTNDAIYYYKKAININPNYAEAHNNLGNALKDSGKFEKAISCYKKAININPNYAEAYYNLGIIFEKLNNFQESINCYKKAIEIKPNYTRAHNNLLFNICWSNKNEKYLEFAKKYYDIMPEFGDNKFIWPNSSNEKILKVGFVSGDFRNHPLGYFLLDTLKNLKKKNLKLFAYSNNKLEDEQTKLLKQYFDSWIVIIHETERNLMNLIRKDNLDILFDLSGHTKNNRLPIFKNRCAPVQATWCGWLASTGIKEIDYIIGDMHSTPLSDQWKFIEKIYQLKKIWQCLSISGLESKISSTKKNNEKFVTFGSFHNILKINESVITTWSKILNQVPNSKLLLKTSSFNILEVRENFLKLFANNGVNKNQIIFNGNSPRSEYLQFYNNIDIALDTFPINGGTTSFEAAYMGVPVLTKISEKSFWFRSGESINKNLSMNDWIAKDEEDYVSKAIKFSENKNYLINLKNELRNIAIKSPLFDSESFSNDFYEMLLNIAKR